MLSDVGGGRHFETTVLDGLSQELQRWHAVGVALYLS